MKQTTPQRGAAERKPDGTPLEASLVLIRDVAGRLGLRPRLVLIWARRGHNGAPAAIKLSDRLYAMHRHEADAWVARILQQREAPGEEA